MEAKFLTLLDGVWIDDSIFELHAPLIFQSQLLNQTITAPIGFKTDFASVPRVPIIYEQFGDKAHHESVIHDYLYFTAMTTRANSDGVFLEAMKARGKSWFVSYGMYLGVRAGGWVAWNEHRKKGDPNGLKI